MWTELYFGPEKIDFDFINDIWLWIKIFLVPCFSWCFRLPLINNIRLPLNLAYKGSIHLECHILFLSLSLILALISIEKIKMKKKRNRSSLETRGPATYVVGGAPVIQYIIIKYFKDLAYRTGLLVSPIIWVQPPPPSLHPPPPKKNVSPKINIIIWFSPLVLFIKKIYIYIKFANWII